MSGIYIHVPFCTKRCYYCDFYSSVNTNLSSDFVSALLKEIDKRSNYLLSNSSARSEISTVYFGGGTPSLLSPLMLEKIFTKLRSTFPIANEAEITFEANPDDLLFEYILAIKNLGVNRLSIGIQSFNDDDLKLMNRRHNVEQSFQSIENAIKAGITNLSIDLIYGLPEMTTGLWQKNLDTAFGLPITHISAYHLGIEENTVFANWLEKGKIHEIPEDVSWQQFRMLHEVALNSGFEHYEISNLSLPGYESKHNSAYWKGIPYIGIGPSAHSFNGTSRQWNVSNLKSYLETISADKAAYELETLSDKDKANEYIMTGLRTAKGIDLDLFKLKFGEKYYHILQRFISQHTNNENVIIEGKNLILTLKGWFVSDNIISNLLIE